LEPSPHDARFFSVAFHAAAFISGFAPSPTSVNDDLKPRKYDEIPELMDSLPVQT
jgi:hypothetical protein